LQQQSKLVGIDNSQPMLEKARQKLYQINLKLHRIKAIPRLPLCPMARPFNIEIAESVEYLEKSLDKARTVSQKKNCKCSTGLSVDKSNSIKNSHSV
jgi:hypothetical protein